ncbi:hypothetical protein O1R50_12895 [Glycomyces luteolus]|uniref:Uncharacterized protein n=1 Tax=Glycomyces luteolus TaxID=2670330 RepID=A0A9X3PBA1_9ACTN|nr:hypothetical protein [Glycomyces luteolus]MDA1360527.1 hypothetical protein [Glycomyces luteolus]
MSFSHEHDVDPRPTRDLKRRSVFAAGGVFLAAAAAAVVPFQGASAAPAGEDACVLQELPMPEGRYFSLVTAMSGDGDVIAYRVYPALLEGQERATYLYEDGEAVELPLPGTEQTLTGVNSDGVAVGASWVDGLLVPYVFRDGELWELGVEGGGTPTDVNEDGDIVGYSDQEYTQPVAWRDGSLKAETLQLPKGAVSGTASSIDEDGTIVGTYHTEDGFSRPYVWHPDGTGEELPMPEGADPAELFLTASVIADGWVGGNVYSPGLETGVRWNLEDGTVELTDVPMALAINEEGTVAGAAEPLAVFQEEDGKVVELPGLVDPADNWFGDYATEISDDGELVAGQVYAGQDEADNHILKAVTWTCD